MKTLRTRLTLTHTLVALLAVLLMSLLASLLIVRAYAQLERQQALMMGQRAAQMLEPYYHHHRGWGNIAEELDRRFRDRPTIEERRFVLADQDGVVVYDSEHRLEGETLPEPLRRIGVPVREGNRNVGVVVVPIGGNYRSEEGTAFVRSILFIVVVGSVVACGVALLVALVMARQVTTPIRSLTQAAHRLATRERHQPLAVPSDAELAELSQAFNTMAANLEHQEEIRRQLTADIAHELRTPLSVLRLQIESLEDGIEQPSPAVYASLHQEVDSLSRLIEDLRLLSLADAGKLPLSLEALDAQQALERTATTVAPLARQRAIDMRVDHPDESLPLVRADSQRLMQVLGNLVENALRYTPEGGQVTLRALPHGHSPDQVVFEVTDTGPGIAPDDVPYIFDRFYRTDRARTRETGGSGLGLAIVQRLVEAQGGQVSVDSTVGEGSTFRVVLPVAQPDEVA